MKRTFIRRPVAWTDNSPLRAAVDRCQEEARRRAGSKDVALIERLPPYIDESGAWIETVWEYEAVDRPAQSGPLPRNALERLMKSG